LTVSDKGSIGERIDESGPMIKDMISAIGAEVTLYEIVPDEQQIISNKLIDWADRTGVDLILTNGGTGLSQRDITPEATSAVLQKLAPGFAETMRIESMKKTPRGMLSRGVSGARGKTLIINLPGSPKAVRECLETIIPVLEHAIEILVGQASECATDDHQH
jgi:molybdenum cofactor synthesis domain-containing protein